MRMPAVIVSGNITGDHHHRNRIKRSGGNTGCRVRETGPEMGQHDASFACGSGIAIRGMCRDLLVTRGDESNVALPERIEQRDHGVAAQTKNHFDADTFEVFDEQVG